MVELIMHGINNSSSPIKGDYTPNELFLGPGAGIMPRLVTQETLFLTQGSKVIDPKNVGNVMTNLDRLKQDYELLVM